MTVLFLCHQALAQSWWLQVLSWAIVFSSKALPEPPRDLTYQNRRTKRRGENVSPTLRDGDGRALEMAHVANAKQESPFFKKPQPCSQAEKCQLCFLLALTEMICIKVKCLVWSESRATEAAAGKQLGVVSLPGHSWQRCQDHIYHVVLICQVSKTVIYNGYKILNSLIFCIHSSSATPYWKHPITFSKKFLYKEND